MILSSDLRTAKSSVRSILVIRLSAIGDVVMASPLIRLLRARYPDARIAWMVQPEAQVLLSANTALDEVIVWPRNEWAQLWKNGRWWQLLQEATGFIRRLRYMRFDLVIDLQGLFKSGIWARFSGAPERIGLGSKEGSRIFMTQIVEKPRGDKRIGSEYRHIAQVLGLDGREFSMEVALTDADRHKAQALRVQHAVSEHYAVICPFTTRPQKHWVEQYWPELAQRLQQELGLHTIMLGGPGDRAVAERIVATGHGKIADMVGGTSLRHAAALISQARLLVGVDTGLTHMGTAFGIPTIAIFGSTCPYLLTDSAKTLVLYKNLECSPCRRHPTCDGAYTCMRTVAVNEVIDAARGLIAQT